MSDPDNLGLVETARGFRVETAQGLDETPLGGLRLDRSRSALPVVSCAPNQAPVSSLGGPCFSDISKHSEKSVHSTMLA